MNSLADTPDQDLHHPEVLHHYKRAMELQDPHHQLADDEDFTTAYKDLLQALKVKGKDQLPVAFTSKLNNEVYSILNNQSPFQIETSKGHKFEVSHLSKLGGYAHDFWSCVTCDPEHVADEHFGQGAEVQTSSAPVQSASGSVSESIGGSTTDKVAALKQYLTVKEVEQADPELDPVTKQPIVRDGQTRRFSDMEKKSVVDDG